MPLTPHDPLDDLDDDECSDAYWEGQRRLPLLQRDGLWWIEVGGATVVFALCAIALVLGSAWLALDWLVF